MSEIDLESDGYRETGRHSALTIRRGWRKWLYFARHPILAFVAYQKAYPDQDDEFKSRQLNAIMFGIGTFLAKKFLG